MKKLYSIYGLLFFLIIGLTSCSDDKDDPKPAAQSSFTQNRKIVEINEQVTFTNSSINASRYEWDFGNGQTSTIANPSAIYSSPGVYSVRLTSYNSENISNTTTGVVKVGERYLTAVKINKLNFSTSTGGNWDFNDGPDLIFQFGKASNTTSWDFGFNLGNNFTQTMLPLNSQLPNPIKLTNEDWDFQLEDYDSADPNDVMAIWKGNPYVFGQKDYNTGLGSFKLTGQQLEIEMIFEIK